MNILLCKQSLAMPKRCSIMGARSELGRFPLAKEIVTNILKYDGKDELVCMAAESQQNLARNSCNSFTFVDVVSKLKDQLQITDYELPLIDINRNQIRGKLTKEGKKLSKACERFYIEKIFEPFCNLERENELDKLHIYGVIKTVFRYETYLDTTQKYTNALTRFRLSCHWLPIERGRYKNPVVPREQRLCPYCNGDVGNELHGLLECNSAKLLNLKNTFLPRIFCICSQIHKHRANFSSCG